MGESFWNSQMTVCKCTRKAVPSILGAHWRSLRQLKTHRQQSPHPVGHTMKNVSHAMQEKGITTYKIWETHMTCSKGRGLGTRDQLCHCLQLITWASTVPSSPLRWYAVTHLAQSKCSVCFLNVTMFISLELPLCELRHLNLSTFQVAVTINPCLRSPQVTQVSWIGWIKRQNVQTGGSCHIIAQKACSPPKSKPSLRYGSGWLTDFL